MPVKPTLTVLLVLALSCFSATAFAQSILPAVFVTNNVGDSVTSFTLNTDGSLNYVGMAASTDSPQCISLSPDGRFIAVGHGTISSTVEDLIIYEVNADATLTQKLVTTTPDSPLDCQWLTDTILAVSKTDLSDTNYLITYEWDETSNILTAADMADTGTFHTSIAVSFERSLVFCNNSLGADSIYSFTYDASGNLTLNENQSTGTVSPVGIDCPADGNFVYGAGGITGGRHAIIAYAVDANGDLSSIAGATSPGESPKVIDITSDGMVLLAGHGTDATVQSFIRNPGTGLIAPSGFSFDVGSQGNLGDLQIMGDLMFVTDESTSDDGVKGLYSFRINSNGSFTQLGPIVDTQGSRPEYIAAWPGIGDPVVVAPESFVIIEGVLSSGGAPELADSDNADLSIERNTFAIQSATGFEIKSISPTETPTLFDFRLEGSVFARSEVTQTIELFNYVSGQFELVDARAASGFADQTVNVSPTGNLSRFVEAGTRCIEARVRYQSANNRQQFKSNTDQTVWSIQ